MASNSAKKAPAPMAVMDLARQLGERIALARRRRQLTQQDLSSRAGIARATLVKLEQGHPGNSLGSCLAVLWVLGLAGDVALLADPLADREGVTLEAARYGERVRPERGLSDDF
jgi:DNA-binding XRE family transcriptional regulator